MLKRLSRARQGRTMNDSTQVSWLKRLSGGLKRSSASLGDALAQPSKVELDAAIEKVLARVAKPLEVTAKPFVILVAGVNGSGKPTTIGKLASKFRAEGKSVMLVAGDTFRAAAIDQLK